MQKQKQVPDESRLQLRTAMHTESKEIKEVTQIQAAMHCNKLARRPMHHSPIMSAFVCFLTSVG
jgi:hypothetical protein